MKLAHEGWPFLLGGLLLSGAAWIWAVLAGGLVASTAAFALSALTLFVLWFFRDPIRAQPGDAALVVAPGEGRVIEIREIEEPSFLRETARRITIFLSVFDVHVQRAPVSGRVEHREYVPGKYLVAWKEKASHENERASLGITTPQGRVLVKQIAGLVARRIITDQQVGDAVERGQRIGLIRFGSRVDLFVPLHWEVTCEVGDTVRVGVTPLARMPVAVEA
ncbi:MAG TPA: phosphatidylserine decarboxylase family protein [Longimicrobiales bacterium]|nr:phosphatidylserine decarboxylase family protein [Longimicrobiales bacterium]